MTKRDVTGEQDAAADNAGQIPPGGARVTLPIDAHAGDLFIQADVGAVRDDMWAMSIPPERLWSLCFDGDAERVNPLYGLAGVLREILVENGADIAECRLSTNATLFLRIFAERTLQLALNGDLDATAKSSVLPSALGFTWKGGSVFARFEADGRAHFAEHRRMAARRAGMRADAADKAAHGEAVDRTVLRRRHRARKTGVRLVKPDTT